MTAYPQSQRENIEHGRGHNTADKIGNIKEFHHAFCPQQPLFPEKKEKHCHANTQHTQNCTGFPSGRAINQLYLVFPFRQRKREIPSGSAVQGNLFPIDKRLPARIPSRYRKYNRTLRQTPTCKQSLSARARLHLRQNANRRGTSKPSPFHVPTGYR